MRHATVFLMGVACGGLASLASGAWSRDGARHDPCAQAATPAHAASTDRTPGDQDTAAAAPAPASSAPDSALANGPPPNTPEAIAKLPPDTVENLLLPVQDVKPSALTDTFTQARSEGRVHDAIDIMAARGTPVLATHDGHLVKLFDSKRGGLTIYEFDPQDRVIYYYAHLDRYAPGLAEGQVLHRGDIIGFVGSTGNASADAPHLHFEIEMLGPKKEWWHGTSINPYGRFAGQQGSDTAGDGAKASR